MNNYRTETKLQRITHFKDSSWGHHHSGLVSNVTGAKQHSHHLGESYWVSDPHPHTAVPLADILSLATSSSHTEHSGQSQGFWMVNPRLSCSWYDESISTNKCASAINTPLKCRLALISASLPECGGSSSRAERHTSGAKGTKTICTDQGLQPMLFISCSC